MADIPIYEEVEVKCVGCRKKVKVMMHAGSKEEDFLCQKCSGLGGVSLEDDLED